MNNDYVWIFNNTALASGLNGVFSLEYHIPASKTKVAPETLVGSRIWLVVKDGNEAFLYALLSPSIIELYQEGKYKNDFLLQCEPFSSIRFLPRQESRAPWQIPFKEDEGIRKCTDVEQSTFLEIVSKNHRIGFAPPSRAILELVPRTTFNDLEHAVPDQLMSTFRTISFGDVSRSRTLPDFVSALGGIALTILKLTHPHLREEDVINLIVALDPLTKATKGSLMKSPEEISRVLSSLPPIVDTFLEEIDPEKISPRTFVAKAPNLSLEWIDKTNDAEKEHEKILKDLVLHLKSRGFKVYKTRSFDLFAEKANTRFLWEIKSANIFNSISQGEKGIIQLLRYSTAFTDDARIRFILLIQDSEQRAIHQYLSRLAGRIGSELCLYDEKKDWPQRVFSFEHGAVLNLM